MLSCFPYPSKYIIITLFKMVYYNLLYSRFIYQMTILFSHLHSSSWSENYQFHFNLEHVASYVFKTNKKSLCFTKFHASLFDLSSFPVYK